MRTSSLTFQLYDLLDMTTEEMSDGTTAGSPAKTTEEATMTMCPRSDRMPRVISGATREILADAMEPAEESVARPTAPQGSGDDVRLTVCPRLTGTADTITGATTEVPADALRPTKRTWCDQLPPKCLM